jgi:hypothetical protein
MGHVLAVIIGENGCQMIMLLLVENSDGSFFFKKEGIMMVRAVTCLSYRLIVSQRFCSQSTE